MALVSIAWPGRKDDTATDHKTVDGGQLAPYPGMTDEQLHDFECDMNVPVMTFPNGPPVAGSLQQRAAKNYPDNAYLQAEYIRAVGVVRGTKNGWVADVTPLPPVPERWQQ